MTDDQRQVTVAAPGHLVDRADTLADVLDVDRAAVISRALRRYLQRQTQDEAVVQVIAGAYYDDEIGFDQLQALVGAEEAANLRVLKQQLSEEFVEDLVQERGGR